VLEDVRVAIVGCGRMGEERARACRALGAQLVAVHDIDIRAARSVAGGPSASVMSSLSDFDWSSIDAVLVCTPPRVRVEPVVLAIRAGVPVLVEKPAGSDARSVAPICVELERSGGLVAVGYTNRCRSSVRRLRQELEGEALLGINAVWVAPPYDRPWWGAAHGAGPLNDYATHLVDLCRYFAGDVHAVSAVELAGGSSGAALLELEGGASATLLYSSFGNRREIGFEVVRAEQRDRLLGWDLQREDDEPEDVFLRETRMFLEAVIDPAQSSELCDFSDALRTQEVVDAIARATRSGRQQLVEPDELQVQRTVRAPIG
jgi:predicted dehydrogenase